MRKRLLVMCVIVACIACACSKKNEEETSSEPVEATTTQQEESDVDEYNRPIIAKALGIDENSRNIPFILSALNTIKSGKLQSAEASYVGNDKVLNVVAEDGVRYQIYLTGSGSVDSVKNLDTGEWVIRSTR